MKTALSSLVVIIFALQTVAAPATIVEKKYRRVRTVDNKQPTPPSFDIPRQLRFLLKLEKHPELDEPGSLWEVSYQLRVSDLDSYTRWAASQGTQAAQREPGVLLKSGSFTRHDLANDETRKMRVDIPVTAGGDLYWRFFHLKKKPQVMWMNLTIRISDKTSHIKIVEDRKPLWEMRYFIDDITGRVIMGVTPAGKLRWAITDPPPWDCPSKGIRVEPK